MTTLHLDSKLHDSTSAQSALSTGAAPATRFERLLTNQVGRAAFAAPFGVLGAFHFLNASAMAAAVPIPGGVFWVYLTGAALVAGAIGIATGILGRWAAYGLALLMLTFVVTVHAPGLSNPAQAQMSLIGLLKDVGLLGGALAWARIFGERSAKARA
jgi:putative oxidoreductase